MASPRRTPRRAAGPFALLLAVLPGLVLAGGAAHAAGPAEGGAPPGAGGAVQQDFAGAAAEFGVPLPVLLAVGYESSWWESHGGQPSAAGNYGIMGLSDVPAGANAGGRSAEDLASNHSDGPSAHTLAAAAGLIHADPAKVRTDTKQNIRAGAALLASYQKQATGGTSPDPGQWYGAVARYSGSPRADGAKSYADAAYTAMHSGVRRALADGQVVSLAAVPDARPDTGQLDRLGLQTGGPGNEKADCPAGLDCRFMPAAEGNYQHTNRPANGIAINRIVVHDTETTYDQAIAIFQNPATHVSANYVIRSSDGAITQMVPNADVAFHAGNYWTNLHAIGIEHEGYAVEGAAWYTPQQYEASARLARYLADKFGIPLDREHIVGHDNVPGVSGKLVADQHWDPGPYWDWARYMKLVHGESPDAANQTPKVGSVVRISPDFAHNVQTVEVCDDAGSCVPRTQPSNFLFVRTAPDPKAPIFGDPALHPHASGTDRIEDWGGTVVTGQQFVVADQHGDWTAIWYSGAKVWFFNPDGKETSPGDPDAKIVHPKAEAAEIPVYATAYPQPDEYPPGFKPSTQEPLGVYVIPAGQAYVATAPPEQADDLFTKPKDTVVVGKKKYLTIQLNHRVAQLDTADIQ